MKIEIGYCKKKYKANIEIISLAIEEMNPKNKNNFIILSKEKQYYMQLLQLADGEYSIEYREGNENNHFENKYTISKNDAMACFISYLLGKDEYKDVIEWKKWK